MFSFCIRVFQKFLKNLTCAIRKNYWGKRKKKSVIILQGKRCLGKARRRKSGFESFPETLVLCWLKNIAHLKPVHKLLEASRAIGAWD